MTDFVSTSDGRRHLGNTDVNGENNIKKDLTEIENEVAKWTNMDQCSVQGRAVVARVMYRTRNAGYFITRRDTVSVSCRTVFRRDSYKICGFLNKVWWRKFTFCSINSSDLYNNRIERDQWRSFEAKLYTGHVSVSLMYVGLFSVIFTFDELNMLSFSFHGKLISSAIF